MIEGITILLIFQLFGEVVARALNLTVPGPVIGLMFLSIALLVWVRFRPNLSDTKLAQTSMAILASLGVLFVPASVGIVDQLDLLGAHVVGIIVTVLVSTLLTMIATVLTFVFVKRLLARRSS